VINAAVTRKAKRRFAGGGSKRLTPSMHRRHSTGLAGLPSSGSCDGLTSESLCGGLGPRRFGAFLAGEAIRHEIQESCADLLAFASSVSLHPSYEFFHGLTALRCWRRETYFRTGGILPCSFENPLCKPIAEIQTGCIGPVGRWRRAEAGKIASRADGEVDSRLRRSGNAGHRQEDE